MNNVPMSKITCMVDVDVAPLMDTVLTDLALPEVFIQRGKQVSLRERNGWFGLRSTAVLEENRAWIYRFCVPMELEGAYMRRITEAADLHLPGRGSIYSQHAELRRSAVPQVDKHLLGELAGENRWSAVTHGLLICIVQRGMAEALARTVLDMGISVPLISFGEGMGLRGKLGLLRITIPIEKELIYFIVPEHDADLLEGVAVHKARLDRPGQGFIYRSSVRAAAVNLQVRRGGRRHAASMEQVVAALDDIRGSAEWRRNAAAGRHVLHSKVRRPDELVCLSLVAEEGTLGEFIRAAMDAGAGGATLIALERRRYGPAAQGGQPETATTTGAATSHAWETCDIIIPANLKERVLQLVEERGFFNETTRGIAEITVAQRAITNN